MKKMKHVIATALVMSTVCLGIVGCGSGKNNIGADAAVSNNASQNKGNSDEIVTLHIFNSKGENAAEFEAMCKAFEEETGIPVSPFSVGAGTSAAEPLRMQMQSKEPPAIFSMQGLKELPEWLESGVALDLNTVTDPQMKAIVEAMPENMRLSPDGVASYGIPYNVEGYGYMVDSQMIADLFGSGNEVNILKDLRTCSFDDFKAFCEAIDSYIENPSAVQVNLNGNTYTFQAEKTGRAANLNGVFSVAGSEKWTYGDHTVNVALNTVLSTSREASQITNEQFEALRNPLIAYMKNLDFITQHAGGLKGPAQRGLDLINPANFGYDQSVQIFADGNAVFLQQGNWAASNVAKVDASVAERCSFLPVKMPMTADMMKTGKTVEELNSSIPVFVPNYYAINAKASPQAQKQAIQFLIWMDQPENIQKYMIDSFKFIPYNADSTMTITNALSNSIMTYIEEGKTLAAAYHGAPGQWSGDILGAKIMEEYLTKSEWNEQSYSDLADFAIEQWKGLLAEN